ncbi:MAG: hypothetical protein ACKO5K_03815 [Armatimonadota bacterium]
MKIRRGQAIRSLLFLSVLPLLGIAPARADIGMISIRLNLEGCPT